jgi:cold shock CspA family protein
MTGTVTAFDAVVGLGTITPTSGSGGAAALPFHCVAIADGSRVIEVGTVVDYAVIPKLGRYEAWAIRPV